MSFLRCSLALSALSILASCDSGPPRSQTPDTGTTGPDAGPAADTGPPPGDGGPVTCGPTATPSMLELQPASVGLLVGQQRTARASFLQAFCADLTVTLSSSMPTVATVPATVSVPRGLTVGNIPVTAVARGTTTITATVRHFDRTQTVMMEVVVTDDTIPTCAGSARGRLMPGGQVVVAAGTTLAGAGVALQAGAARADMYQVAPLDVTVDCAPDQVPTGFRALGPAVRIGPVHGRYLREIPITIPLRLSRLPAAATRGHVEFSYTGPGVSTPRIVPVASPQFIGSAGDGLVKFEVPRLGTYQAVVRTGAGTPRMREYKYRAVTGFSMGSGGSSLLGMNHPEEFDFVAPLGGPTDWIHLMHYIRTWHLGGFCNETQRRADPTGCAAGASLARTPPPEDVFEHTQTYESWWYEDAYGGQGGTFDREEYLQIFSDLAIMFGNPNTQRTADLSAPNVTPPGVPDTDRMRPDSERCATPRVIPPCSGASPTCAMGTGFHDDEYNPTGAYPVISFCDGAERPEAGGGSDAGNWDPMGNQRSAVNVALAVDINANGRRDPGEPVMRAGDELYDDFGLDGVPSRMEAGYDATTNPDPAGDDYDYQYNPAGTERNWLRDGPDDMPGRAGMAEPFLDAGLDGVMGTVQLAAGGYDFGEGNGRFDRASGLTRMLDKNPRGRVLRMDMSQLMNVDVWGDGGVRDLFNFAVNTNHFAGAFSARGLPMRFYNGHAALTLDGRRDDEAFQFSGTTWEDVGRNVVVRYGDPDAPEASLVDGDGGHVGTGLQLVNRLVSALAWMGRRWPDLDRRRASYLPCTSPGTCAPANRIKFDFTSSDGRTGPAVVLLPPGYFDAANANLRYPVVYLMHGYGQEPDDLVETSLIFWTYMTAANIPEERRIPKMIFVFPDGRCRGPNECIRGTFYANGNPTTPGAPQMEDWVLELAERVDRDYRTRAPEMHPTVD